MKKLTYNIRVKLAAILIAALPFSQIIAEERTPEEMLSIAESVFGKRIQKERAKIGTATAAASQMLKISATSAEIISDSPYNKEAFHVYTFQNGAPGYVIVSSDDRMPEILGFSDTENFSSEDIPDGMRAMLTAYSEILSGTTVEEGIKHAEEVNNNTSSVAPLLGDIAFNQNAPFNDKCPLDNGERSVVGCLATAMSELMAYHRYPARMEGSNISYTTKTKKIPVKWDCSQTVFDWDNILDKYSSYVPEFTGTIKTNSSQYLIVTGIALSQQYYGYIELYNFLNITTSSLNFTAQLILADNSGRMIRPVGNALEVTNLPMYNMYPTYYLTHSMPRDLEDGTYRLYIGVKKKGESTWSIVKRATNTNDMYNSSRVACYMTVKKSGNTYTINKETFDCSYTKEEGDAVATLSASCGVSARMDYTASESGATQADGMAGLYKNMQYDDRMMMIDNSFFTDEEWHSHIQAELNESRPIICCGAAKTGVAHAYIIDGYKFMNGKAYYHISWGWGGTSNGYFLITDMTPGAAGTGGTSTNYGYQVWLTTGLMPKDNVDDGYTLGISELSINRSTVSSLQGISITSKNLINCSAQSFKGRIKAYAIDSLQNEYLIGTYYTYNGEWKTYHGFTEIKQTLRIPSTIPTGDYRIELRAMANGSSVEKKVLTPILPKLQINNPTAIESINIDGEENDENIYDISGRKINDTQNGVIHIKSGKKYIIR